MNSFIANQFSVLVLLVIALLHVLPANGQPAEIPTGAVQWSTSAGGDGNWFEPVVVPGGIDWTNAENDAVSAGGYLATITSATENAFVYSLVNQNQYWTTDGVGDVPGPWLGGTYDINSGGVGPDAGWSWVTGEPWSYTNWYPGDPNHRNDGGAYDYPQDSLCFYGQGNDVSDRSPMWDDDYHSQMNHVAYVVEFNSVPEPSTLALLGAGVIVVLGYALQRRRSF